MNPLVIKMAPAAIVLLVGCYVAWPYIGGDSGAVAAASTGEPIEIADLLLHPRPAPSPLRDPFADPEESLLLARREVVSRLNALKKAIEVRKQTRLATQKPKGGSKAVSAEDALAGLLLNATYTGSGRDGALINGRIYQLGDNVRPDTPDEPCVLSEVRLHSVVVRVRGQELELKYSAAAPRTARTAAPAKRKSKTQVKTASSN